MALVQHSDIQVRFDQQFHNAQEYVLPFIEENLPVRPEIRVLEIGTAEGGVLRPFADRGCYVLGVDLSETRIRKARQLMDDYCSRGLAEFRAKNVYDEDFLGEWEGQFDLIILKDTIEHIPDQEHFIPYIKKFLKEGGRIFFGFPPWCMPFGGHQQICKSKFASLLPWYHLLPRFLYKLMLKLFGESAKTITDLMEIKDTGISTHRFERIVKNSGLHIYKRTHFLINPIYKYKFGLHARKQAGLITAIPGFRDFSTTCAYYLVG